MKRKFVVEFERLESDEGVSDFGFRIFTVNDEDKSRRLSRAGRANSLKLAIGKVRQRLLWLEHPV